MENMYSTTNEQSTGILLFHQSIAFTSNSGEKRTRLIGKTQIMILGRAGKMKNCISPASQLRRIEDVHIFVLGWP